MIDPEIDLELPEVKPKRKRKPRPKRGVAAPAMLNVTQLDGETIMLAGVGEYWMELQLSNDTTLVVDLRAGTAHLEARDGATLGLIKRPIAS